MSLSSNSIIHFTNSSDALKGILQNGFKVHICQENIILGGELIEINVPMVSFCDIPLSKIKEHIIKYGEYGVGFTKEWAEKNGLNPVLYVEKNSLLSHSLLASIARSIGDGCWTLEEKQDVDIIRYIKNYKADLVRKSGTTPDYRFSDEREWRYVPSNTDECVYLFGSKSSISDDKWTSALTELENMSLKFEPNDIKYIFIKNDREISDFISFLRQNKGGEYSLYDIERLTTRIITSEQIFTDV